MPMERNSSDQTRPTGDILRQVLEDAQEIIRGEIQLAAIELKREAVKAAIATGGLVAGSLIVLYGIAFLLVCLYFALTYAIWPWASALAIGGFLFLFGAAVAGWGFRRLRRVHPLPEQTLNSLKEDLRWLKKQTK